MSEFRKYLSKTYAADPAGLSRFVSGAVTLVRIQRRYWRGYRKMKTVEVREEGTELDDTIVTRPSWKLCPKEMLDEFAALDKDVGDLIESYCFVPGPEDEEGDASAATIMVGGGRYAVDTGTWPRLEKLLVQAQTRWGEVADSWTTEDGYARFKDLLKEQIGASVYSRIEELIPDRQKLRGRYGLFYRKAPVRFVDDVPAVGSDADGLRDELVDLLDLAVRKPRETAADVWESLGNRLIGPTGQALKPMKKGKEGNQTPSSRSIQGKTLSSCRAATVALERADRYTDDILSNCRGKILATIPDSTAEAAVFAKTLNADDAEAVRFGKILFEAARAARDEAGMCAGLSRAVGHPSTR